MEEEMIGIGEGNIPLAKTCEALFYKNGNPMLFVLSRSLSAPAEEFAKNYPLENFQDNGPVL